MRLAEGAAERFFAKAKFAPSGCLEWQGAYTRDGYGTFATGERSSRGYAKVAAAHRVAWTLANGPIPKGMHVMHKCDNKRCVDWSHLRIGTHTDNLRDMYSKGRGRVVTQAGQPRARLAWPQVREIRSLYLSKLFSINDLAKRYGVSMKTVSNILEGRSWKT